MLDLTQSVAHTIDSIDGRLILTLAPKVVVPMSEMKAPDSEASSSETQMAYVTAPDERRSCGPLHAGCSQVTQGFVAYPAGSTKR